MGNLKVYTMEFGEGSAFNCISLVDFPAVEEDFIQLDKVHTILSINDERRIVSGVALIPDKLIYRRDTVRGEYYITFPQETIEKMAMEFFKQHKNTEGNVQHSVDVQGVNFFESYILNKDRGICPNEFKSLPNGTWIVSAKIDNEDVWKLVKEGKLRGFSIDASLIMKSDIEHLLDNYNK